MPATDALVARLHDYAETSVVALLLTADRGALRVIAKGARRLRNGFLGPLDKGVLYRVRLGRRGEGLFHLNSAAVREPLPRLRSDPARFLAAALVLEVAADLMRENEPMEELFRLATYTLKVLDRAPAERLPLATALFLARAVRLSGHLPEIECCVACGEKLGAGVRPLLGPLRGGVLHPECGQGEPGARSVDPAALALLAALWRLPARDALQLAPPPAELRALRRLLADWLEQVLERRFRCAGPVEREFAAAAGYDRGR